MSWNESSRTRLGPADDEIPAASALRVCTRSAAPPLSAQSAAGRGVNSAGRAHASVEGGALQALPFGEHARVGGAAVIGNRFVVVTDTSTGTAPEIGVTIWVGEVP